MEFSIFSYIKQFSNGGVLSRPRLKTAPANTFLSIDQFPDEVRHDRSGNLTLTPQFLGDFDAISDTLSAEKNVPVLGDKRPEG